MGQTSSKTTLNGIIRSVNRYTVHLSAEKLYLHTDKPSYNSGDTLWFKGYLFDQALTNSMVKSRLLYIELVNDSNEVVKRMLVPVYRGLTFGQLTLGEELPEGGYILRAYTSHMRNFGEDYVYTKPFYISKATANQWLIEYRPRVSKEGGKETLQLGLQLTGFDQVPVGLRELQLRLTDGRRTLLKQNTSTTAGGLLDLSLSLPEKVNAFALTLTLQDERKGEGNRIMQIPVPLNRAAYTDLQFMPEGGHLVAGLPANVAFKAIGEDGKGTDIAGKINNSNQEEVAKFTSEHNGMGSFQILPQAGETYTARVSLPGNITKTYTLPEVRASGIHLQVINPFDSDSCEIVIRATPDIAKQNYSYYLVGQARDKVCYGASFSFSKAGTKKLHVSKSTFPTGILRFILSGPDSTALSERIIYINHRDNLDIQLQASKTLYKTRDNVALTIQVKDKDGNPVQGSFSLAVTDDRQVKPDSITDETIMSRMLLTGDLKGTVEDPSYYINPDASEAKHRHLDQLLLTQGWVGYDWQDIFRPKPLTYQAEQEYMIRGKVLNAFNKPVNQSTVTLLSKKPMMVKDTITNGQGQFTFKDLIPSDTTVYFIQSKNRKGNSFNVGIEIDEFKPPVFTEATNPVQPWYVNADTTRLQAVKQQITLRQIREEKLTGGRMMKEVVVTAKKIVRDSKNLNGPGEADIIVDEEQISKAGRKSLGDLMKERIPGFRSYYIGEETFYKIRDLKVHLTMDGVNAGTFQLKRYFDYIDADEIKGIEVMTSSKNQVNYMLRHYGLYSGYWEFAFIEVTTRSGHGPFLKKNAGTYLYKPLPFILPKQFYAPKYTSRSSNPLPDIRSTIHWEPNVVTGKDGKAIVTFYTADTPGSYSLVLQGTDMRGNLGVQRAKIKIEK